MKKFLLSAFVLCSATANAQNAVVSVRDKETNSKDEAVATYYLPKTIFEIEVDAVNKKFKAGPYAGDAKRLFGSSAEFQDRDNWEIKSISIKRKAEPDQAQRYKVYAAPGSAGALISLTGQEILRGVNLSLGYDLEGNSAPYPANARPEKGRRQKNKDKGCSDNAFKNNFKYKENDSATVKNDADFAYDLINGLRMTRAEILQQEGDEVKEIDAFLRNIDKEEKELYALFYGKVCPEEVHTTFRFSPDKEGNNQEVGKLASRNGSGESSEAISISIKKRFSTSKVNNSGGKTGYVYRVPALADVELKFGKTTVWKGTMEIAQLGTTESLPVNFFDKNDMKALFDKETGALLQIGK